MRAVVYTEPEKFSVTEVPDRALAPGEVRMENVIVGVCGTDSHLHIGEFGPVYPLTPGHEIVGRITELGEGAQGFAIGDLVAVDNTIYCFACPPCKRGDFLWCHNGVALGVQAPGGFAEHTIAQATRCYPIGDLSLEAAALIEPTACVVHGLDRMDITPADDVLIIGAGPTSQILAQLVGHGGAGSVTVAAPNAAKLAVAKSHGANHTVLVDRNDFAASTEELLAIAPEGFDIVIDGTGAISVLSQLIPFVKSCGTLMVYGMAGEEESISIKPFELFRREITLRGSFAQSYEFARAIKLLQGGKVDPTGIITHSFGLDEYADALGSLRRPEVLKAVMYPNGPQD